MAVCPNCGEDNPERARLCMMCGTALQAQAAPSQEARKTVTIVFCDLVGSTALGERLDSESLREVMDRYFTEMRRIVERHGGIVEKYIGDAIMAIFGLPSAHEDDALRAVRAASEMSSALENVNGELEHNWGLRLANRTGINTGEVVIGDPSSGQRLATGDAVNVAARLEQAAPTNQVLLGKGTYRLVKDGVSVEAVEPLALKGKSERLGAFLLLGVKGEAEGISRRLDAPLVGRSEELAELVDAFEAVAQENRCHLITVFGEAGVGKSRLLAELTQRLRSRAGVLKGRCLSYGEGITFWPLAEVIREAAAITDEHSPEEACRKIEHLVAGTEDGIADRISAVMGLSSASFPIEESFWAARRLLEHLARSEPLVVILEDIHWAEPTFLDWIGHLVALAQAPILVVCAARPELREERRSWGRSSPSASLIDLQPLSGSNSHTLIDNLLGGSAASPEIRERITAAAQGNPLFVEQIISMWTDDGTLRRDVGSWGLRPDAPTLIPPTISALLAARLDRLDKEERAVVAGASIVGQVFYRGAVEELCPPVVKPKVPTSLSVLEERQFIRPDQSTFADEQAFAFRHVLIRDAAYEAILKRTRAELHERFASWLEQVAGERISEYEEIVGYHLEQAHDHFRALGRRDDRIEEVGRRASHHLSSAGKRALGRGDATGAANLLERAVSVLPRPDYERAELLPDLALALTDSGDFPKAERVLNEALEIAQHCDYEEVATYARLGRIRLRRFSEPEGLHQEALREAELIIPLFERLGDERGQAKAWNVSAHSQWALGRIGLAEQAWRAATQHATAARDPRELAEGLFWIAVAAAFGPTPAPRGLETCRLIAKEAEGDRTVQAVTCEMRGFLEAMRRRFDQARALTRIAQSLYEDLGLGVMGAVLSQNAGFVEMLAGDAAAAEREYRRGYGLLQGMGEQGYLCTLAALLGDALCRQGRFPEAEHFSVISEETASADDVTAQALWRSVRAKAIAHSDDSDAAQRLAREAVTKVEHTEFMHDRAEAQMSLAEVLSDTGELTEARSAAMTALKLYEQKGNIVSSARARKLLEELK